MNDEVQNTRPCPKCGSYILGATKEGNLWWWGCRNCDFHTAKTTYPEGTKHAAIVESLFNSWNEDGE